MHDPHGEHQGRALITTFERDARQMDRSIGELLRELLRPATGADHQNRRQVHRPPRIREGLEDTWPNSAPSI